MAMLREPASLERPRDACKMIDVTLDARGGAPHGDAPEKIFVSGPLIRILSKQSGQVPAGASSPCSSGEAHHLELRGLAPSDMAAQRVFGPPRAGVVRAAPPAAVALPRWRAAECVADFPCSRICVGPRRGTAGKGAGAGAGARGGEFGPRGRTGALELAPPRAASPKVQAASTFSCDCCDWQPPRAALTRLAPRYHLAHIHAPMPNVEPQPAGARACGLAHRRAAAQRART